MFRVSISPGVGVDAVTYDADEVVIGNLTNSTSQLRLEQDNRRGHRLLFVNTNAVAAVYAEVVDQDAPKAEPAPVAAPAPEPPASTDAPSS